MQCCSDVILTFQSYLNVYLKYLIREENVHFIVKIVFIILFKLGENGIHNTLYKSYIKKRQTYCFLIHFLSRQCQIATNSFLTLHKSKSKKSKRETHTKNYEYPQAFSPLVLMELAIFLKYVS